MDGLRTRGQAETTEVANPEARVSMVIVGHRCPAKVPDGRYACVLTRNDGPEGITGDGEAMVARDVIDGH
jgi:hypothetical protein